MKLCNLDTLIFLFSLILNQMINPKGFSGWVLPKKVT